MKRIVMPAAAVAALLIAALWWFALSRTLPAERAAAEATGAAPAPPSKAPARVQPAAEPAVSRGGVPFTPSRPFPLRDRIRDATDLRALYEKMKDETDRTGEASYRLAEAIFECSAFVDVPYDDLSKRLALVKKALDVPRREEVFAFMFERCKGFSGNPAAMQETIQALHKRADAAGYPAEIARGLRYEAGKRDPEGADKTAIALLSDNKDPDVVHELAQYVNVRNVGVPAYRNVDAATRQIAWGLLECDYGADCGPRSRPVMMTCVVLGVCDLQRVEEAILVQGSQAVVNKASAARDALARQIAARDWNAVGFAPRFSDYPGAPK